jgi:phosphoribosylformylglycinamidine cyclo-ligase
MQTSKNIFDPKPRRSMKKITYKSSGVNVEAGNEFVKRIKGVAAKTMTEGAISPIGGFGGLFSLENLKMENPVFVSSADGVGTKVKLAIELEKYDTVGIDAVAMNVNDILTCGAKPLFFLDYLAVGKLKIEKSVKIVEGVAKGCKISGCALIGGETAEMPDVYRNEDFDLAGFCVGVVEKSRIISGENIADGDLIIGLKSSGFHSNGYSLVRTVVKNAKLNLSRKYDGFKRTLGELLIEPTHIYVLPVLDLLESVKVNGMAHITGGSFRDKLGRIIPDGLCAKINRNSWQLPPIFKFIQNEGAIEDDEMYGTFNCGIGFILIASQEESRKILDQFGTQAVEIGYVEKSDREKVVLI